MNRIQLDDKKVLFDLERVRMGFLYINSKTLPVCHYGPYRHFTPFKIEFVREGEKWKSRKFITCRYIVADRAFGDGEAEFKDDSYQGSRTGEFLCDDERLNRIFEIAANTIQACAFPHRYGNHFRDWLSQEQLDFVENWRGEDSNDRVLVDGPRRDREVWIGDLVPEVLTWMYIFGDKTVIRNSINVILARMTEDGYIPACSISWQTYYEYSAWFLCVFYNYILLSGDMAFLNKNYSSLLKIMGYLKKVIGKDGAFCLEKQQTWAWTMQRKGRVTSSNCVLVYSYRCMAQMSRWIGEEKQAQTFDRKAGELTDLIFRESFDKSRAAFYDIMDDPTRYSLDANAYAILFDICPIQYRERTLQSMTELFRDKFGAVLLNPKEPEDGRNWLHNDQVWPFLVGFEIEARLIAGDLDGALELMLCCHGTMANHGADTFWEVMEPADGSFPVRRNCVADKEEMDTFASACHGWSASVGYLLQRYIGGIRSLSPGFKKIGFDPHPGNLNHIKTHVPTPNGVVKAEMLRLNKNVYSVEIDIPENSQLVYTGTGEFYLNDKSIINATSGKYVLEL